MLIAGKEFGDRLRSGWVIACVLVWLGAVGLTSVFGLLQIGRIGMQGYERTVLSLLNLVQYLIPLLGLLLGFELVVAEKEEQTLRLLLAGGVSRTRLLMGKFLGGSLALAVPLVFGFAIAGTAIGLAAPGHGLGQFLKLAFSGLGLGVLFLALGLMISTFSRTRVQALVLALLAWCLAVFVFDLVALGCLVSTRSGAAAQEIDFMCDATHVNAAADLHSAYDNMSEVPAPTAAIASAQSLGWLALNPVDLFRAMNLPAETGIRVPALTLVLATALWLMFCLGAGAWKFNKNRFMKPKIVLAILLAVTLTAVLSVLALHHHNRMSHAAPAGAKTFEVLGQVRSVDVVNKLVRITHEEIPDYMPAMTMPLSVKDPALLQGLSAGDRVQFQLVVTEDDSWIGRMEKVATAAVPETASAQTPSSLQELETERVQVGELVPDFTLLNQDRRPIHLSDFRGKAVLLTFIYTRCPLPNFCPLMSKNFSELEHRLSAEFTNRFELLSVSMDPEFDTPEVLKAYAARYEARADDWAFATGDAEQIKFVTDLMGLYYARENGLITHDFRTALIGPDGRLVHLWKSNVWTPYEVQRRVRETLTGTKDIAAR